MHKPEWGLDSGGKNVTAMRTGAGDVAAVVLSPGVASAERQWQRAGAIAGKTLDQDMLAG
ncbi:hypothetical protein [Rugamonas apoptosis]|uniref:Uncharacterized protein n=1 Tax=Rugamonas apoptosis TaxID=2758570 RepID=A0A7W2ILA7_9BURK|nr:hypothetical protein [Rugamonas apoptosis]MBA5688246.1 hypothetical protein [Rugamonas apoptosis]